MKFSVLNLGCKVNSYETESIASMLEDKGMERVDFKDAADVSMIFTCAVTNVAAQKSRQMINRARRTNPDGCIVVAGCYAQIDPEALDMADILVGSAHKMEIPEYVMNFLENKEKIRNVHPINALPFEPMLMSRSETHTRAYLKIQDGCNQFCTYCVIPYARGRERSMDPDTVIEQVKQISREHKEIVLTGIHTGRYGREYKVTLAELMKRILNETPLERLRISSIEMTELDEQFLNLFINEKRIARHLHIPLQSGSDTVLKRMNRPYTAAEYLNKIQMIRKMVPEVSISCDLIVGFPQETDEEFEEMYQFLKKCEFSFIHVFPFSSRDGTVAAGMSDHISPEIKKQRVNRCVSLSEELYDNYKQSKLDQCVEVLVETNNNGKAFGHTSEYLPVILDQEYDKGTIVNVKLTDLVDHQLFGEGIEQ